MPGNNYPGEQLSGIPGNMTIDDSWISRLWKNISYHLKTWKTREAGKYTSAKTVGENKNLTKQAIKMYTIHKTILAWTYKFYIKQEGPEGPGSLT